MSRGGVCSGKLFWKISNSSHKSIYLREKEREREGERERRRERERERERESPLSIKL